MKRVLIYGASGFIGTHIHHALEIYCDVVGVAFKHTRKDLAYSDVTKYKMVKEDILGCQPDYVVFAAGNKNRDASYSRLYKDNTVPIQNIYKVIAQNKLKTRVIFISTDSVFAGDIGNYSDMEAPWPITNYGKTKYLAEQALEPTASRYGHDNPVDYRIIRTSAVIGKGSLFLSWLQENMMLDSFKVYDKHFLSPTSIELLTNSIIYIIENWDKVKNPILHICGKRMSRYEFACMVKKANPDFKAIVCKDETGKFYDTSMIPSAIQEKIIHKPMEVYLQELFYKK